MLAASLSALVALLHLMFFALESLLWKTPTGMKVFGQSAQQANQTALLASNQGVYNLLLSLGLFWTLASKGPGADAVRIFILLYILGVGLYGGYTVSRGIYFLQAAPALLALLACVFAMGNPRINDITTSLEKAPSFSYLAKQEPARDWTYPGESFWQLQKKHYPGVLPLTLDLPPQEAQALIEEVISQKTNWKLQHKEPGHIEASQSTQFFRFVDDIAIDLHQTESGRSLIQVRSKSRMGRSDFAKNAQRIRDFLDQIRVAVYARNDR